MAANQPRGIALIEALVAVAIIGSAAIGWMALSAQTTETLTLTHQREREVRAATRLVARFAVRSARELDDLVGRRRVDGFRLHVSRVTPELYMIEAFVHGSSEPILATKVFRAAGTSDAR